MTKENLGKITENTLIPVSVLAVLAAGIFFAAATYFQGQANATAITELKASQSSYGDVVNRIDKRLTRIEGKLGVNE